MSAYSQILDHIVKDKKSNLAGQISLFDIADESQKDEFDVRMPEVGEYPKDMILAFEKEVLGIYLSGHPLEADREIWQKYITHSTNDFALDDEIGSAGVSDQADVVVGGMIADKTIKYTKNDKVMAFLNLEDLVGNVEVIVFPKDYERYSMLLKEDAKLFIKGRASVEEDKDGKVICEQVVTFEEAMQAEGQPIFQNRYGWQQGAGHGFRGTSGMAGRMAIRENSSGSGQGNSDCKSALERENTGQTQQCAGKMPNGIWIQFPDADSYALRERELLETIADSDGNDDVVIYIKNSKCYKVLPPNRRVSADGYLAEKLMSVFGQENVKIR